MKIEDISFRDYVNLKDKSRYNFALRYGKFEAHDILKIGSFLDKPFGFVKDMQFYSSVGLNWDVFFSTLKEVLKKDEKELAGMSLFELHRQRLYCIEQVENINKMESEYLGDKPTYEQTIAGIDRFDEYGAFIQFDKLADGNILKFDSIKNLPYDLCFTKLKLEADRDSFIEEWQNIMKNKKK
jgi:hypothetical protein